MGCCGANRTVTDYLITYGDGTSVTIKHEDGGLARVRQEMAKRRQDGVTSTYKAVPRPK